MSISLSAQNEVSCRTDVESCETLWNVEGHFNERLPHVPPSKYTQSFWQSLIEVRCLLSLHRVYVFSTEPSQLNVAMARVNNALLPKEGEETSRPWQWPVNYKVIS